jgi:hypothetical protein
VLGLGWSAAGGSRLWAGAEVGLGQPLKVNSDMMPNVFLPLSSSMIPQLPVKVDKPQNIRRMSVLFHYLGAAILALLAGDAAEFWASLTRLDFVWRR